MEHKIQLPFQDSHAFIIGINDYQHVSPLSTALNDAKMLANHLTKHHNYQVHGPLLNTSKADLVQLLEEDMPKLVGSDDRVLFYFAGHGIALDSDDNPKGYLVPTDAKPGETESLVSMDLLHNAFTSLPCQHGILIMDCCFAGSFKWSIGFRDIVFDLPAIIYEERFYQYAQDPAWQVITSSASDQKAADILSNRTLGMRNESGVSNSPFALALLDGLAGEADTIPKERGDGVITATELYTYLRDRVEDDTTEYGIRQSPSMFSLSRHDKGQYIFLHPRHPLNLPPIPRRNPFMGLQSYNEDDTLLFFGRDRVITALNKLTETSSFVVVSGASGTGKSSVIKAGLLPLLRKKGWQVLPVVRPGKEPMQSLRTEIPDLPEQLSETTPSLLIIDQYEELITQCLDPNERITFEKQLANWMDAYPQLRIVISIRSDFEPQFEQATLSNRWQEGHFVVPAFSQDELREVIIKPTIQEVLFFEPDSLVDKLVDAVNQAPGALPLLSFTLSELYHTYLNSGRTNRAFTLKDYEKLGGVIGTLRTRANTIYDELDEVHRDSMRRLMIRMVSLEGGELASRRVGSGNLVFSDSAETQRVKRIAQQLVEARLVSTGRDKDGHTYYEPAHDALVRAWARLWEWIKAQGEGKQGLMYKLSLAVADYQAHGDKAGAKEYLWHDDPRLDLLHVDLMSEDHGFNAQEEAFLKSSMYLRKRNTQRTRIIVGSVIVMLMVISGAAFWQRNEARKQAENAQEQTRNAMYSDSIARVEANNARIQAESALAAQNRAEISDSISTMERDIAKTERDRALALLVTAKGRDAFNQQDYTMAFSLAAEAWNLAPVSEVVDFLSELMTAKTKMYYYQRENIPFDEKFKMAVSPNDRLFLVGQNNIVGENAALLYDSDWNLIKTIEKGRNNAMNNSLEYTSVAFSSDGNYLGLGIQDSTLVIYSSKGNHKSTFKVGHVPEEITFSPEGKHLMIRSQSILSFWSTEGKFIWEGYTSTLGDIIFDVRTKQPRIIFFDGEKMVNTSILDLPPYRLLNSYYSDEYHISPDGGWLALVPKKEIGDWQQKKVTVYLYKKTGEQLLFSDSLVSNQSSVAIDFSPDSKFLLVYGRDQFYCTNVFTGNEEIWQTSFMGFCSRTPVFLNRSPKLIIYSTCGFSGVGRSNYYTPIPTCYRFDLRLVDHKFNVSLNEVADSLRMIDFAKLNDKVPKTLKSDNYFIDGLMIRNSLGKDLQNMAASAEFLSLDELEEVKEIRFTPNGQFILGFVKDFYQGDLEFIINTPRWDYIWAQNWVYRLSEQEKKNIGLN